jgi:5'-nucleotidase
MRILATNDDGVRSEGLHALVQALLDRGDQVDVVAPAEEQSAISRALTMNRVLRATPAPLPGLEVRCLAVNGTPADCVKLGVLELLDVRPDMVVSGINIGTNIGGDVLYSGTVAAAMEAAYLGLPAVALSTAARGGRPDFGDAAKALEWVFNLLAVHPLPNGSILNVNFPQNIKGFRVAPLGDLHYREGYCRRTDPRGGDYYWLEGGPTGEKDDAQTDVYWFERGYCTVTPLKLDITNYEFLHDIGV